MQKGFHVSNIYYTILDNQSSREQNTLLRLLLEKPACRRGSKGPPLHLRKNRGLTINLFLQCLMAAHPNLRTGYLPQVSIAAREEQIQSRALSTHQILRPIPQSTKDSEASKHSHGVSVHPAPREVRSRLQRTSPIQKRNYQTFQTPKRTKGPLFFHIQMKPQMTRGTNSNDYSFAFFYLFFLFLLFFFFIEPCIGQYKN